MIGYDLECHARTVTIEPVATGGIVVGRNLWPPGFNVTTRLQCDHKATNASTVHIPQKYFHY